MLRGIRRQKETTEGERADMDVVVVDVVVSVGVVDLAVVVAVILDSEGERQEGGDIFDSECNADVRRINAGVRSLKTKLMEYGMITRFWVSTVHSNKNT